MSTSSRWNLALVAGFCVTTVLCLWHSETVGVPPSHRRLGPFNTRCRGQCGHDPHRKMCGKLLGNRKNEGTYCMNCGHKEQKCYSAWSNARKQKQLAQEKASKEKRMMARV